MVEKTADFVFMRIERIASAEVAYLADVENAVEAVLVAYDTKFASPEEPTSEAQFSAQWMSCCVFHFRPIATKCVSFLFLPSLSLSRLLRAKATGRFPIVVACFSSLFR